MTTAPALFAPYHRHNSPDGIPVLDLFSGAGGLTHGFHAASSRVYTTRSVEFDAAAAASFTATFGDVVFAGPIQDWLVQESVPSADIVIGGPPCQGFSQLGNQDPDDIRNSLWRPYAEALSKAQPKYFVVENVPQFSKSQQLQDFKDATDPGGIVSDYTFKWDILNAADYGAPQARKRAILIGHHRDLPFPGFPEKTHKDAPRTVKDAFSGIRRNPTDTDLPKRFVEFAGKEYRGAFKTTELHLVRNYIQLSLDRFASIPVGGNRFDLPDSLKAPCWLKHQTGSGDVMGRMHWNRPSVTIRTEFFKPEKGRYIHPFADRAITHFEAARLQGFPDDALWVGSKTTIAKQIGNAVPIALGKAIASQLIMSL